MVDRSSQSPDYNDPRMRGFRVRDSVDHVLALIDTRVGGPRPEVVSLLDKAGRVLLTEIAAGAPVPSFDRAAMDGYALHGEETFGAELYAPAIFREVGKARPGHGFGSTVNPGEAVEIATGAPIPPGADTVVPVEATVRYGESILVTEPFPVGRHIGRSGEDVLEGVVVLSASRILRPQDLGVLSRASAHLTVDGKQVRTDGV